ncbi:MAG: ACT domain-containing protein [Clostridia bacterium]|nr:ACT domain-containing protein [Clostridia bacterium]MBO7150491.1 ACT domain-containing protein [Clostridia bacterium]
MRAVVTVIGRDSIGIIADVSAMCSKFGANIIDISQSVMREYFAMIMLVELGALEVDFDSFAASLSALGKEKGLEIHAMHEDIFNAMHRI